MEPRGNQLTYAGVRLFFAAAMAAILAITPGVALAVDKDAHADRAELRIKDMHDKLMITRAQEEQWTKVALIMRDNAKTMDTLTQARKKHATGMTAVENMKSYGEIVDAHADGIKKVTPVFADLYASMSDPQKKVADKLFHHGDRRHGNRKQNLKKSQGN